ncbi:MAG: thiol-disulfide oxidoreductase DCC family protein [Woeseiaceae bacterium]
MNTEENSPIILFDGICNLCESSVHFVIRRDSTKRFRFAALQSAAARKTLTPFDYTCDHLSSVLLVSDGKLYRKSRAALQITRHLDGAWPLMYYVFFWVPRIIADPVYDFVGKRRYRWFGKKSECWIPNEELRARFLDDPVGSE